MLSDRAIVTLDIDLSLHSLSSAATAALLLHLSVDVDSSRHTLTRAHVDSVVLSTLAHHTVVLDRDSASKVGCYSTTSNSLWSLAFNDASVLGSVDELFWTVLDEDLSGREALGVDVSFALLASTSDALVLDSLPGIADHSLLAFVVDASQWHAGTATGSRVGNSRVTNWPM